MSFAGPAAVASMWQKLGVARLTSFVLRSIERHTRWVFGAQRADELPADLERQVWIFLSRLKQGDALAGKTPEQAFFVRTSARAARRGSATASGDVAITLRIGFAPERANEFVTYDFRYHERSMTTEVVLVAGRGEPPRLLELALARRSRRRPASRSRTGRPRANSTDAVAASRSTAPSARIT